MEYKTDQAKPTRAGEEINIVQLNTYLKEHAAQVGEVIEITQFPGGFSNLTYCLKTAEKEYVLRRPPFGANIKSAHDMGREFRVLSLLKNHYTKVPQPIIFCEDEIQFIENIISLAEQKKWKHIYCWEPSLQAILAKYDYPFAASENEFISADVGITLCEGLVARTGSILIHSSTHAGRRLSIYPNSHIVLAYTSQIFPDMKDALADLKNKYGEKLPSLYTAITGPSRTADIEKTLVLGAHGPKELFLFLIDDQI